jgi:hypothetical protein
VINFCFDKIEDLSTNEVYPNLAPYIKGNFHDINYKFSQVYPYSDTPRLLEYMTQGNIEYKIHLTNNCPNDSFYFININYFDHNVDWFELMPYITLMKLRNKEIKVLFFYCEADSPYDIKQTLHFHALSHGVDINQVHFISHSTDAEALTNFYYFNDDEFLYKSAQKYSNNQSKWNNSTKKKTFTFLIRSSKNWRLIVGAEFYSNGYHDISYTSYNNISFADGFDYLDEFDDAKQNPLWGDNMDLKSIEKFKQIIPYSADELDDDAHNSYETHVDDFYSNSYWNLVCETHIDIENSNGTFITEKTWKPIKHNQPFIILGTVHSLKHLKDMGYKTFGNVIDESYDDEVNAISRYAKIKEVINELSLKTPEELYDINQKVKDNVIHNSILFNSSKPYRISELFKKIYG